MTDLQPEDFEYTDSPPLSPSTNSTQLHPSSSSSHNPSNDGDFNNNRPQLQPSRSQYHLPPSERIRGLANRIIFSRYYVLFYFVMMSLSLTTVVLSLIATTGGGCPPLSWHILEVIINLMMVLEVGTRWVAYGKKYPMTPLNILDLLLVLFCGVTLILVFKNPCGEGTRQEEVLDTILLVIRNAVQFLRLFNILRRSGHSIFNPPKPIDLSQARTASLALELDLDLDDEEAVAERQLVHSYGGGAGAPQGRRTLVGAGGRGGGGGYEPLFNEEEDLEAGPPPPRDGGVGAGGRKPLSVGNNAGRDQLGEDDIEAWDRLG